MGKVLHQYALCDFDAADEFLGAMHPALLEVHAPCTCMRHMPHVMSHGLVMRVGACVAHAWHMQ